MATGSSHRIPLPRSLETRRGHSPAPVRHRAQGSFESELQNVIAFLSLAIVTAIVMYLALRL